MTGKNSRFQIRWVHLKCVHVFHSQITCETGMWRAKRRITKAKQGFSPGVFQRCWFLEGRLQNDFPLGDFFQGKNYTTPVISPDRKQLWDSDSVWKAWSKFLWEEFCLGCLWRPIFQKDHPIKGPKNHKLFQKDPFFTAKLKQKYHPNWRHPKFPLHSPELVKQHKLQAEDFDRQVQHRGEMGRCW